MSEKIKNAYPQVAGQCPMGCGETLFIGEGGHVTCSTGECPDPIAVDKLLSVPPEVEHIGVFDIGGDTFTSEHPSRERIAGDLFDCPLQSYLCYLVGPPVGPGRYRVTPDPTTRGWTFEKISSTDTDEERTEKEN